MANNNEAGSGGINFCGLLTILFIALKLMGYIGWSWIWVVSPLWIPLAIVLFLATIAAIVSLFVK